MDCGNGSAKAPDGETSQTQPMSSQTVMVLRCRFMSCRIRRCRARFGSIDNDQNGMLQCDSESNRTAVDSRRVTSWI